MKQHSKLRQGEEQGTEELKQSQKSSEAKEFASVEEMLRFDATQNPPPPGLAQRINESIDKEPKQTSLLGRLRSFFSKGK